MKRVLAAIVISAFTLSGCALFHNDNTQTVSLEVPEALTFVPPEPKSPNPQTVTQRDVARYIIQLRAWGRQLALQLNQIRELSDQP